MKKNIDNIELLLPLLTFDNEDDFYFLQILQRKKENELLTSNSRVIKNYYINSIDSLKQHYEEIKSLCNLFNARASLRLNRRSHEQIAFQTMMRVTNSIMSRDYMSVRRAYDRTCGQYNKEKNKKWIIDIDDKNAPLERISTAIKFCSPNEGEDKIYITVPTKNGCHLITSPFNVEQFTKTSRMQIDIHKDNPTLLYMQL